MAMTSQGFSPSFISPNHGDESSFSEALSSMTDPSSGQALSGFGSPASAPGLPTGHQVGLDGA